MDLLAFREHSQQEIVAKLSRRFGDREVSIDILSDVVNILAEDNLQSDQRFAESFLRSRIQKKHGPIRIANELAGRGVASSIATQVLDCANIDWNELLEALSDRKYGHSKPADAKEIAKRIRFFQYRGFSYEHIQRLNLNSHRFS